MKDKKNSLITNIAFQKRWTINSIKNITTVLKTPNILHDVDKSLFKGKPAIIVSAGPSLNEEFENLRYIKEKGLAYIFSVGSAINSLIEKGIYPDAACTYDPSEKNQYVFQKIIDKNIQDIPLIFGSSVGFETLEGYPGPQLHMLTSQDTITPKFVNKSKEINIVIDAPSIAVVTLQLLNKLGCSPIILVGQNLGFQDNKRYASGITYDFVNNELSDIEIENAMLINDVKGNKIKTNEGFNLMRQQLEMHIRLSPNIQVINTTKGGANIEGTKFIILEDLIKEKFTKKVVNEFWYQESNSYDMNFVVNTHRKLVNASKEYNQIIEKSISKLKAIQLSIQLRKVKELERNFSQFDMEFGKMKNNIFYTSFIEPMIRVQYDNLLEKNKVSRFEKDIIKKGNLVVQNFGVFLEECIANYQFVLPLFDEMNNKINLLKSELESQ